MTNKPAQADKRQRPRTCVACREESPKRALIRVVRSPSGNVVLDERGKLPGRGENLCARLECVEKAKKNKTLSRALKTDVKPEIYDRLAEYISEYGAHGDESEKIDVQKELRSLLGLARRAGLLYIGVDSVKSHSAKESLLILTAAGCSDSVHSAAVFSAASARGEGGGHIHLDVPLDVSALSSAIGADGVQAAALPSRGGLADKIKMLICGQQRSLLNAEGRVALEQNESV